MTRVVGALRQQAVPSTLQAETLAVVIFVTTNGMYNGVVGSFFGKTIAQIRGIIGGMGYSISQLTPAFLNGNPVPHDKEKVVHLNSVDGVSFGWIPPPPQTSGPRGVSRSA